MIRLALPKGRNLETALEAFRAAGVGFDGLEAADRRLQASFAEDGFEVVFLKDWDVPLYVQQGIADWGVVGSDVIEELDGDLLVPARFNRGLSRLSLIGREGALPQPGQQVRLASKYVATARRVVSGRPWGAEILKLHGSVELAPLLDLADLALDIVQTGRTIRDNDLHELETVGRVAPCLVVNRGAYQLHREALNRLLDRFEEVEVVD
jgi:ATP phosphoribosyltransferase